MQPPQVATKEEVLTKIDSQVKSNAVVIYMKGSPQIPSCGFSARAAQVLLATGENFAFVNVLADPDIMTYLPEYADWPTFPQIYISGELIGGSDILIEMAEKNELKEVLAEANKANQ